MSIHHENDHELDVSRDECRDMRVFERRLVGAIDAALRRDGSLLALGAHRVELRVHVGQPNRAEVVRAHSRQAAWIVGEAVRALGIGPERVLQGPHGREPRAVTVHLEPQLPDVDGPVQGWAARVDVAHFVCEESARVWTWAETLAWSQDLRRVRRAQGSAHTST